MIRLLYYIICFIGSFVYIQETHQTIAVYVYEIGENEWMDKKIGIMSVQDINYRSFLQAMQFKNDWSQFQNQKLNLWITDLVLLQID